jgi:hypothetical protein
MRPKKKKWQDNLYVYQWKKNEDFEKQDKDSLQ